MDWNTILMLDHNEEQFEKGIVNAPVICDYTITANSEDVMQSIPCDCYLCVMLGK